MDPSTPPDPHARAVITAYRAGEHMPAPTRDAAWQRLTTAIADEDAAAGVRPIRRAWFVGGAVLLAAAAAILVVSELRRDAGRQASEVRDQQAAHDLDPANPEAVRTRGPTGEPKAIDPALTPIEPATREPSRRPTAPTRDVELDVELGAELALLRSARDALARSSPELALRELAEHQRRFPGGLLAEERMVLRVQALCESGLTEQARAAARDFTQAHPGSPHLATCEP